MIISSVSNIGELNEIMIKKIQPSASNLGHTLSIPYVLKTAEPCQCVKKQADFFL